MRYISRIWNWDWVAPYLDRLDAADRASLSGDSMPPVGVVAGSSVLATSVLSETSTHAGVAGTEEADQATKRKRDAAIEAARERALKRRRAG